jgi:hypothetical protein
MTDDPGLVKLAHGVTPMMLSVFARDPSSPAPQLTLFGQGLEGATLAVQNAPTRAGKAKRVNIQSGCILDSFSAYPSSSYPPRTPDNILGRVSG